MQRNKVIIIEKDTNRETGLDCILLFDEYNGVCESLNEDATHKVGFDNMVQVVRQIQNYQQQGFSFIFKGFN